MGVVALRDKVSRLRIEDGTNGAAPLSHRPCGVADSIPVLQPQIPDVNAYLRFAALPKCAPHAVLELALLRDKTREWLHATRSGVVAPDTVGLALSASFQAAANNTMVAATATVHVVAAIHVTASAPS